MVGYNELSPLAAGISVTPNGTFAVKDNSDSCSVPLKGVKVRCHKLVKWATAFTDENGSYTMDKSFRYNPHYEIVFDNKKGFDIWRFGGAIGCARHSIGKQDRNGYSCVIDTLDVAWDWAVINNSAYEYYKMCETTGIAKPPTDLKILNWNNGLGSSAAMIRRIENHGELGLINFYINTKFGINLSISQLLDAFRVVIPDITINTLSKSYAEIYNEVNHELAHASHFSVVGTSYWTRYIYHIIQNWGYGSGEAGDPQLCSIGEMWAYYMGYARTCQKYPSIVGEISQPRDWIHPQKLWLMDSLNILSPKQIFDCLTPAVDTIDELVERMYLLYPDKALQISLILSADPPLIHNVRLPGYDSLIYGVEYSSSVEVTGDRICIKDVNVTEGATLTINALTLVTILEPFIVEKGSSVNISVGV